jgi:hypothetical protein
MSKTRWIILVQPSGETRRMYPGCIRRYTRSRDALKAIRPKKWCFTVRGLQYNKKSFASAISQEYTEADDWGEGIISKVPVEFAIECATEELAELHAIIQAIEYERERHINAKSMELSGGR